ncbi:MAG: energy transducer TonB [Sinobacteraceae bacterium]|nr:energy transducer TonB [Nevskiaceae bacterium]
MVREAKLIRRVRPDYPSAARRESIVGSVDLDVTVSSRGDVTNIAVLRADPPGMFEKSAVSAVRKWKYDPQYVDGLPADAHLNVHLDFNPG